MICSLDENRCYCWCDCKHRKADTELEAGREPRKKAWPDDSKNQVVEDEKDCTEDEKRNSNSNVAKKKNQIRDRHAPPPPWPPRPPPRPLWSRRPKEIARHRALLTFLTKDGGEARRSSSSTQPAGKTHVTEDSPENESESHGIGERVKEVEDQMEEHWKTLHSQMDEFISVARSAPLVAEDENLRKELAEKEEELQQKDELIMMLSEKERMCNVEKEEELQQKDELIIMLSKKERMCNVELQGARQVLLQYVRDTPGDQTIIGIKRMGEVDPKPFSDVCRLRFLEEDHCMVQSMQACSLWQTHVNDPNWHPFERVIVEGKEQEIINKNDEKIQESRNEWGEGAYEAVALH
ncbi:hypothetical protein Tsubulata_015843 [Turnera subulata]|uniref:Factor of DNA methylation 1-5/IDN2 domain-containing protein n=1 Tax=Turnera subulata TaxID=218843 RepID=A0A9Q0GD70_9ROSI|nr:hypothetical protein Tsubulata_015843 [Turnera subulata]